MFFYFYQVLLQSGDHGEQFDEVVIDEHQPVLADIFLDAESNPKHLIAASPYKVSSFLTIFTK